GWRRYRPGVPDTFAQNVVDVDPAGRRALVPAGSSPDVSGGPRNQQTPCPGASQPTGRRRRPSNGSPGSIVLVVAGKDVVDVGAAVAVMGDSSAAQTALEVGGPQARPLISC